MRSEPPAELGKLLMDISVTKLGDFWKFSVTNIPWKVSKLFGDFLGYFEKRHF